MRIKFRLAVEPLDRYAFMGNLDALFFISPAECWSHASFWGAERIADF